MITVVYYDQYDSEYSEKDGDFQNALASNGLLIATENINDSFAAVEKHQKENECESEIEYCFEFWNAGEAFAHVNLVGSIEKFKEDVLQYVKSFLH